MTILTLAQFWEQLGVARMDLFPPTLATSSRTGAGSVIRVRSFGEDLWRASVTLQRCNHEKARMRRALLALGQQPGYQFLVNETGYPGINRAGATLLSVGSDNRSMVIGNMGGFHFRVGSLLEVSRHFHTVTSAGATGTNGQASIQVMPHIRPGIPINGAVELRKPVFIAQLEDISPAMFEPVVAGEASFTITQAH